jgi:hypothetical protein
MTRIARVALFVALGLICFSLGGLFLGVGLSRVCSDQGSTINQLNENEFVLHGMIESDHRRIDGLQAELQRTQDELAELKQSGVSSAAPHP